MENKINLKRSTANTIRLLRKCPLMIPQGPLSAKTWAAPTPGGFLKPCTVLTLCLSLLSGCYLFGQCPPNTFHFDASNLLWSGKAAAQPCEKWVSQQHVKAPSKRFYLTNKLQVTWALQGWFCLLQCRPDSCWCVPEIEAAMETPDERTSMQH